MLSNVEQYRVVSILVASHKVWEIDPAIDGCHFGGGFVFSRTPWPSRRSGFPRAQGVYPKY